MNTVRGRAVQAFIAAFCAVEGRGPNAAEVSRGVKIGRAQLIPVFRRLERQRVITRETVFRPHPFTISLAQPRP